MEIASDLTRLLRQYSPQIEALLEKAMLGLEELTAPRLLSVLFKEISGSQNHAFHTIGCWQLIEDIAPALKVSEANGEMAEGIQAAIRRSEAALKEHGDNPAVLKAAHDAFAAILKYSHTPTLIKEASEKIVKIKEAAVIAEEKAENEKKGKKNTQGFVEIYKDPALNTEAKNFVPQNTHPFEIPSSFASSPKSEQESLANTVAIVAAAKNEEIKAKEAVADNWLRILENQMEEAVTADDYLQIAARILVDVWGAKGAVLSRAVFLKEKACEIAKKIMKAELDKNSASATTSIANLSKSHADEFDYTLAS